ncbi:MAG: TetR/AcrR family transcriptional regulator, partial [Bacteroidota bacterium]
MFRIHGVRSVSVDRMTKSLHISRRKLYNLFADKQALLEACLDLHYAEEIAEFKQISEASDNQVDAMFQAWERVLVRELQLSPNFYYDILHYYPELRAAAIERHENFNRAGATRSFQEMIDQGLVRDQFRPAILAETMISFYESILDQRLFEKFPLPPRAFFREAMMPFWLGILTP